MLFLHWMRTPSNAEDDLGRSTLKMLCPSTLNRTRFPQSLLLSHFPQENSVFRRFSVPSNTIAHDTSEDQGDHRRRPRPNS